MRATPSWKKFRHTIYLVQPVLQFLLLILAVTALSRCSPLSPSTDKLSGKSFNPLKSSASESLAATIDEDAFEQNLHDVNATDVQFQSEDEFNNAHKEFPLVVVRIAGESLDVLAQGRDTRVDLASAVPAAIQPEFLATLRSDPGSFNAIAILVMPAKSAQSPQVRLKVQVSVIDHQNAFLRLTHQSNDSPEARAQALHQFSMLARSAKFLAITLQ